MQRKDDGEMTYNRYNYSTGKFESIEPKISPIEYKGLLIYRHGILEVHVVKDSILCANVINVMAAQELIDNGEIQIPAHNPNQAELF